MYFDGFTTFSVAQQMKPINMPTGMTSNNVGYDLGNPAGSSVIIEQVGDYEVTYSIAIDSSNISPRLITLSALHNGSVIPGGTVSGTVSSGAVNSHERTTNTFITHFEPGDRISLSISGDASFSPDLAYPRMTITRLGP